jgi:hypothetical protein
VGQGVAQRRAMRRAEQWGMQGSAHWRGIKCAGQGRPGRIGGQGARKLVLRAGQGITQGRVVPMASQCGGGGGRTKRCGGRAVRKAMLCAWEGSV